MPSTFSRVARWLAAAMLAGACSAQPLANPNQNLSPGDQVPAADDPGSTPGGTNPGTPDLDDDGVPNAEDDCPASPDPDQDDLDLDGVGDDCDDCPTVPDPEQADDDDNGIGDACEGTTPPPPTPFCPPEEDDDLC